MQPIISAAPPPPVTTIFQNLTKKIFPAILKAKRTDDPVRVWIPCCATAEEAWPLVFCLLEYWAGKGNSIKIFATDPDLSKIEYARKGIYGPSLPQNLLVRRWKKFFEKNNEHYQVIRSVRDKCVFAVHDPQKDPPFSNIDLIYCPGHNIAPEAEQQQKIIDSFRYALGRSGYLLLGSFEKEIDPCRLFSLNEPWEPRLSDLPIRKSTPARPGNSGRLKTDSDKEAEFLSSEVLAHYVPAGILVDKELRVRRFYGITSPYLRPAGPASLDLIKLVGDELIFELHTLLDRVKKTGQTVRKEAILLSGNKDMDAKEIAIEVIPVRSPAAEELLLIVIRETPPPVPGESHTTPAKKDEKDRRIQILEEDLLRTRQEMQAIIDHYDTNQHKLQSAHEEMLCSNEELLSSNEQLLASREELGSVIEELSTVNEELYTRNDELKESTEYSAAILETTREPIVILSRDWQIYTANKAFYTIFPETDRRAGSSFDARFFDKADFHAHLQPLTTGKKERIDFEWKYTSRDRRVSRISFHGSRINTSSALGTRILLALRPLA